MIRFLNFLYDRFYVLFYQLIFDNLPLYNNNVVYIRRRDPEDEDLGSDAEDLDGRRLPDGESRREANEYIKRKFGIDPDSPKGEQKCLDLEKVLNREFKKRRLDRDEFNDMPGVENAGRSPSSSLMSEDSDHRQLMEDEMDFIKKKTSEYREENSQKTDYTEEDAHKYAKDCLDKLKDKYDNPDTDHTETDSKHEESSESDSSSESGDSNNGSDKYTVSTKIKDIVKRSGGSGGVSSGGNNDGENNNNGGSDNDSNNYFSGHKFVILLFYIIEALAEFLGNLFS